jgi:O-antigen/teichoic acid export membrane protein
MLSRSRLITALLNPDDRMTPNGLVRLQEEQLAYVRRYTVGTLVGTLCNGFVCCYAIWQSHEGSLAMLWALSLIMAMLPTVWRRRKRHKRDRVRPSTAALIKKATLNAFLLGCCWGA